MPDPAGWPSWTAIASIAFGSSVLGTMVGKLLDRTGARTELVRAGYADAVKALNAWSQFPLRVYRRVDDSAETLLRLEAMGAELKEKLAYSTGWVSGESAELGKVYNALVEQLRAEVAVHARLAWASPPASVAAAMNIGELPPTGAGPSGATPAEWWIVQQFSMLIQYRIGWRRLVWSKPFLRRRLANLRIVERSEEQFRTRSMRRLNGR